MNEKYTPETQPKSDLLAAARSLCEKIRLIHDDPLYQSVWTCALNHGVSYMHGPTYEHELKALEAAVKARTL